MLAARDFARKALSQEARLELGRYFSWPPIIDIGDQRHTVLIAGIGRSGTNWIADVVNYRHNYRYLHEPFGPNATKTSDYFVFGRYVRPACDDPKLLSHVARIVNGRIGHIPWIDKDYRFFATRRLIKETKANLWLAWFHRHFPKVKIVLMMRHPCAVVNSRTRRQNPFYFDFLLQQPELIEDHLQPFREQLERANSLGELEQRAFSYCIDHYVPLRALPAGALHVAFYENFVEKPDEELANLFAFLGEEPTPQALAALKKPSRSTAADDPLVTGRSLTAAWRDQLNARDVKRIMDVVALFGLDRVYGSDPLPQAAAARRPLLLRDDRAAS